MYRIEYSLNIYGEKSLKIILFHPIFTIFYTFLVDWCVTWNQLNRTNESSSKLFDDISQLSSKIIFRLKFKCFSTFRYIFMVKGNQYYWCLCGGVLMFVLLFIFAKRQNMRFSIRSRRGPHVPVGYDATKSIKKKEIERRLDCIQRIAYEPRSYLMMIYCIFCNQIHHFHHIIIA